MDREAEAVGITPILPDGTLVYRTMRRRWADEETDQIDPVAFQIASQGYQQG